MAPIISQTQHFYLTATVDFIVKYAFPQISQISVSHRNENSTS